MRIGFQEHERQNKRQTSENAACKITEHERKSVEETPDNASPTIHPAPPDDTVDCTR